MNRKLKICLIDDDPVFGAILQTVAADFEVDFEFYESLEDLGRVAQLASYDLVICDFFLESFTGKEIAEYVKAFFAGVPIIMVSGNEKVADDSEEWPQCVRGFLSKQLSPADIIKKSIEMSQAGLGYPQGGLVTKTKKGGLYDRSKNTGGFLSGKI